ncbi:phage shock protein C (PspC) family protein [Actinocorallia herbida]|uniref:Phage shock protein C (PspC) family protein n=1 Tax=Actinocorallia herbida TaxID=58109 RepID=A0A3N1D8Q4_9ACTN|nr:PspC domain-containing protein [Actinocorallia herbida]ROO89914.1 phage shock protein C (PspC) family protein [Actinocorallia herbida]
MSTLYRPDRGHGGRWIGGVCAGIARRFGISVALVRVLAVLSCILPGPQFLIYAILWIMLPSEQRHRTRVG